MEHRQMDIADKIKSGLPPDLWTILEKIVALAADGHVQIYLVGGGVRDLLLGNPGFDIDLAVEGNAIALAEKLADALGGTLKTHRRFNTAKMTLGNCVIDLAMCRTETYARPGALPSVRPGEIAEDLLRRDFTVNAIAVRLGPHRLGELVDIYGGLKDLERKYIRVLHDRSFEDDATRIWRAVRYEQRLGFEIEPHTLELLAQDLDKLGTVSGDRIRHELELVLKEASPEKILHRLDELGILSRLHPSLKGDRWLEAAFENTRKNIPECEQSIMPYLGLITYRLRESEVEELITYLRLPKRIAEIIRDTLLVKTSLERLDDDRISPASVYRELHGRSPEAIIINRIVTGNSTVARRNIELYINRLRLERPTLTGSDLREMGISAGQQIKMLLDKLLEARLDGRVEDRNGEESLVKEWQQTGRES